MEFIGRPNVSIPLLEEAVRMAATMPDPFAAAMQAGAGALSQGIGGIMQGYNLAESRSYENDQAKLKSMRESDLATQKADAEAKSQMDLEMKKEEHRTRQAFLEAASKIPGVKLDDLAKFAGLTIPDGMGTNAVPEKPKATTFEQKKELAEISAGLKPPTATAFAARGFADKASQANKNLALLEKSGFKAGSSVEGFAPNLIKSEDRQIFEQAERQFVNAVLRRESGAAIPPEELENYRQQYFPKLGDKPKAVAAKARARELAIKGLEVEAGKVPTQLSIDGDTGGLMERMGTPPGEDKPVLLISTDGGKTWKKKAAKK